MLRFALLKKLALKTPNVLIKIAFFVEIAVFFRTIDGQLRYGTLENSDKNGLCTVLVSFKIPFGIDAI